MILMEVGRRIQMWSSFGRWLEENRIGDDVLTITVMSWSVVQDEMRLTIWSKQMQLWHNFIIKHARWEKQNAGYEMLWPEVWEAQLKEPTNNFLLTLRTICHRELAIVGKHTQLGSHRKQRLLLRIHKGIAVCKTEPWLYPRYVLKYNTLCSNARYPCETGRLPVSDDILSALQMRVCFWRQLCFSRGTILLSPGRTYSRTIRRAQGV